jgi:hypothetical protein
MASNETDMADKHGKHVEALSNGQTGRSLSNEQAGRYGEQVAASDMVSMSEAYQMNRQADMVSMLELIRG